MSTIHESNRTDVQKKIDQIVLERVKRGIAWLEQEHGPDWVDHINMSTLDLRDGDCCVLGQVYADEGDQECRDGYWYACAYPLLQQGQDDQLLGFCIIGEEEQEWDDLQEAWEYVLTPLVSKP